jgi:hypothetical protein
MGFFDSLLTGANALSQGASTYFQTQDALQKREREQGIQDEDREESKRLRALERALMELRIGEAEAGPQPTYGVGAGGRPTMSGARDPGTVEEFMTRHPAQPEAPRVSVSRPTAEGTYGVTGTQEQVTGTLGTLPPMIVPPEQVTPGDRRSDSVINSIVSGFRTETSDHRDAASGYAALKGAYDQLQTGNPAAAIGMLFAYGKILDPGSVVREGELRTLQNIGAYDQRVKNWMDMATKGTMTPEVAQGIMDVAENTLRQRAQAFADVRQNALQRGELQGVSRQELEQIIPDYYRRAFDGGTGASPPAPGGGQFSPDNPFAPRR